jgi:hypothetical protein
MEKTGAHRSKLDDLVTRSSPILHHISKLVPKRSTKHERFVTMPASNTLKGVTMTTEGHIAALERRHQELDRQIQTQLQDRQADHLMVSALKRKKLEVKDELYKLQGAMQQ